MSIKLFAVLKTGMFRIRKQELGFEGDWDATNWRDLNRISQALTLLLLDILEKPQDAFGVCKILQIEGEICSPLIACHLQDGVDLDEHSKIAVDEALNGFVFLITGNVPTDTAAPNELNISSSKALKIESHAKTFLKAHGSKRIPSEIVVKGLQTQITARGRFAPKPLDSISQSTTLMIEGSVDMISISDRKFTIIAGSKSAKLLIRYDERTHFETLRLMLGSPSKYQFEVREIRNGHKISLELVQVSE